MSAPDAASTAAPVVVVTGAAGFVGRHLVAAFAGAGYAVRALVRRMPEELPAGAAETFDWDAATGAPPAALLKGAQAVCHAAAFKPPAMLDPRYAERCLQVNALGTLALLEACVAAGAPHFVYLSAGNAYHTGSGPPGGALAESAPLYPAALAPYYLSSKVVGELYASHFANLERLGVCSLRPSAIYGPGMGAQGLVPNLIRAFRAGQGATLADGGRFQADLVYVEDVARAAVAAVERRAAGIFNVGSGGVTSALEIAEALAAILGRGTESLRVEPATSATAAGFPALDIARARAELGCQPTPLVEGLRRTVAAYEGR